MPKIEMYQAINNPERVFYGRAEYLEYLRGRQRERHSWARMCEGRAKALDRLHGVRLLNSWVEVEEFINDHSRDIDLVCGATDCLFSDFKINVTGSAMTPLDFRQHPVGMDIEYGDEPRGHQMAFVGRFEHRYRRASAPTARDKAKKKTRDSWRRREALDLPHRWLRLSSHTDVLTEIGIISGGGGGGGVYRYSMVAFHQDWDHLRVMERLAA
jgi:hypothetical protein